MSIFLQHNAETPSKNLRLVLTHSYTKKKKNLYFIECHTFTGKKKSNFYVVVESKLQQTKPLGSLGGLLIL